MSQRGVMVGEKKGHPTAVIFICFLSLGSYKPGIVSRFGTQEREKTKEIRSKDRHAIPN
jgi:hypothetical protein